MRIEDVVAGENIDIYSYKAGNKANLTDNLVGKWGENGPCNL